MILANGCPKSGTHALMRLLTTQGKRRVGGYLNAKHARQRLEIRATPSGPPPVSVADAKALPDSFYMHGHVRAAEAVEWARPITIIRDPRNVLVSYVRWGRERRKRYVPDDLAAAMDYFFKHPFPKVYRGFLEWRDRCEIIRYEDIDPTTLRYDVDLYGNPTPNAEPWSRQPSNWRTRWTERIERKWRRIGGPDLVAEAGYPEHDYPIAERGAFRAVVERLTLR